MESYLLTLIDKTLSVIDTKRGTLGFPPHKLSFLLFHPPPPSPHEAYINTSHHLIHKDT